MRHPFLRSRLPLAALLTLAAGPAAHAQGTGFTYNGGLIFSNAPVNGAYDLRFTLYNAATNGVALGAVTNGATPITNGLYTVNLDFGPVFTGANLWIELAARTNNGGAFATLSPRQAILAAPYAMYATLANGFAGTLAGDVTGPQGATVAARVGGQPAAQVAAATAGFLAATATPAPSTLVKRDAAGGLAAGLVTATGLGIGTSAGPNSLTVAGGGSFGQSVGIGTTSPTSALQVNGTATATAFSGGGAGLTGLNASQVTSGTLPPAQLPPNVITTGASGASLTGVALLNGGNSLTGTQVITSGNVGIGTSTPQHTLEVSGNIWLGTGQEGVSFAEIGDSLYLGSPRKYISNTLGQNFNGSTDWLNLMFHPGSSGLMFGTSGPSDADPHSAPNPLMVITPGGNVGIGTTSPSTPLQVNGTVTAMAFSGNGSALTGLNASQLASGTVPSAQLPSNVLRTGSSGTSLTGVALLSGGNNLSGQQIITGNVGIGTAAPATALQVNGTVTATAFSGNGAGLTGLNASQVTSGTLPPAQLPANVITTGSSGTSLSGVALLNSVNTFNANQILNGFLGIGASPGALLTLANNSNPSLQLLLPSSGSELDLGMASASGAWSTFASAGDTVLRSTKNNLILQSGSGAGALTITTANNVGVGTPVPGATLDVAGSFRAQAAVTLNSTLQVTGTATLNGPEVLNNTLQVAGLSTLNGALLVQNPTLYANSGRVGINTTSPDSTLSVNGTADKPGGGSWTTFSDARLKNVGVDFTPGLGALAGLQPVHYHYKSDNPLRLPSEPDYIGVVAQQARAAIPESVQENEAGYLVVNNDPIIWTMVNAIKELDQAGRAKDGRIAQLQSQSEQLKAKSDRVDALEARVAELAAMIKALSEKQ